MAYDATLPVNNSLISSAELRNQFNGLKGLVDARATAADIELAIQNETPATVDSVSLLVLTVSNPPTQAQVQAVLGKLNELINGLKR